MTFRRLIVARIELRQLRKDFDGSVVVHDIDLVIEDGEFVVLVGASGCGKTTTLRMIAGLEAITRGDILLDGKVVNDLPPRARDVAMVFQNYALYPHMSVIENMSFGLRMHKVPKPQIDARVRKVAEILNIGNLLSRRPKQLSGGQRQRVAMGRAMVRQPRVFLFDEPLSNLDAKLRLQMRMEIKRIHQLVKTTTVYVTHDQIEAMTLANRIVIMNEGRIEQVATPQEMYDSPATRFVAAFIGSPGMNFLPCILEECSGGLKVRLDDKFTLNVPEARWVRYRPYVGKSLIFGIRPEHITEKRVHTNSSQIDFAADVAVLEPTGMDTMVYFKINGKDVWARSVPGAVGEVGKPMDLTLDMNHMHLFDANSNRVH